jgi:CHAT domain-containing protein
MILPDGSLNSLNFETLIVSGSKPEDKAHYWIEDVTVTTANSLALLARSSVSGPPNSGRLLVVGDALAASPDFPPLPQAGKEVGLLENYFTSSQRLELTGANATATHFLSSEPEKFSYLHFSTHGTASRTRPLESAVILSPEGDSYKLCARRAEASAECIPGHDFGVQWCGNKILRRRGIGGPVVGVSAGGCAQRDCRIVGSEQRLDSAVDG